MIFYIQRMGRALSTQLIKQSMAKVDIRRVILEGVFASRVYIYNKVYRIERWYER